MKGVLGRVGEPVLGRALRRQAMFTHVPCMLLNIAEKVEMAGCALLGCKGG